MLLLAVASPSAINSVSLVLVYKILNLGVIILEHIRGSLEEVDFFFFLRENHGQSLSTV